MNFNNKFILILIGFTILGSILALNSESDPPEKFSGDENMVYYNPETDSIPEATLDSIISLGKTLLGKPYRYVGPSPRPMDCSGYLSYIFGEYEVVIPHVSGDIGLLVKTIDLSEIKKGDFLFFKGSDINSKGIGHVALVIEVTQETIMIMHSTVSGGIMVQDYNTSTYFKKRFIKAGRL
ncbi:MAG: C40 family peptidase [Cyclobacteriaceae bacterium]|nr:C40 family peptidase [Cyclobacteriaceae bacterium]